MKCTHYACRCARAEEYARIYDRTGNPVYLMAAIGVHMQSVDCRLVTSTPAPPNQEPHHDLRKL
jgi:hypothetical protein